MELRVSLPRLTTVTAITNIYLVLSLMVVQVYGSSRPPQLGGHHQTESDSDHDSLRTQSKRSLDFYEEQEFFQPSVRFQDTAVTNGHKRPEIYRQRYRPGTR